MKAIPKLKLNSGQTIPSIGFGTWQLSAGAETEQSVLKALKDGYRLIDTAKIYGNERSVGTAIKHSGIARQEIFVTTKLWSGDGGYGSALRASDESLDKLSLEYIDLYLIHWPHQERSDSWRALTEIYSQGWSKAIGASNYSISHLKEVIDSSGVFPAVNQIEFHPFIYAEQAPLLDFCAKHKIIVEAYSPLSRARGLNHPVISELAAKHGKTNAQIMLRWAIQHKTIPIPKSAHPERIKENLDVFDFELSSKEMSQLNGLSDGHRVVPI